LKKDDRTPRKRGILVRGNRQNCWRPTLKGRGGGTDKKGNGRETLPKTVRGMVDTQYKRGAVIGRKQDAWGASKEVEKNSVKKKGRSTRTSGGAPLGEERNRGGFVPP